MKIYVLALLIAVTVTVALSLASSIEEVKDNDTKNNKNPINNWNSSQFKPLKEESKNVTINTSQEFMKRIACLFSTYKNDLCVMFCMYRQKTKGKCKNKQCTCFKKPTGKKLKKI